MKTEADILRKIRLIWPGKTREPFMRDGMEKYLKLLMPYARVEILEVREGRGRGQNGVDFESDSILKVVKSDFLLLDSSGSAVTSLEFAELIKDFSPLEFVAGGSYGVNEKVKNRAAKIISLSPMTFTHEMARLILLEQLYRAVTIIQGKEYHH